MTGGANLSIANGQWAVSFDNLNVTDGGETSVLSGTLLADIDNNGTPLDVTDDQTKLNDSFEIVVEGESASVEILKPFQYSAGCRYPQLGTAQVRSGDNEGLIDFGSGNEQCDAEASITIDGSTQVVTLDL